MCEGVTSLSRKSKKERKKRNCVAALMGEWKTKRDFALFRSTSRSQSHDLSSGKKKFQFWGCWGCWGQDCIASGRKMELDKEWHGFARHVEEISCEEAAGDTSNGLCSASASPRTWPRSKLWRGDIIVRNQSDWPTGTVVKPFLLLHTTTTNPHISIDYYSLESRLSNAAATEAADWIYRKYNNFEVLSVISNTIVQTCSSICI